MSKILVIEDDVDILKNILEILKTEGFEVQGEQNGAFGINAARHESPDLILCGVNMPDFSGYTVLEELRCDSKTKSIPFIFITAMSDRDSRRLGMELGADDYLTKPFTPDELIAVVKARLERRDDLVHSEQQKLAEAKRQLMRMVAHELRTPLGNIDSILQIISRQLNQLSRTEVGEYLEAIGASNRRMLRVVDQMIYTMQIEIGTLNRAELDMEGVPMQLREMLFTAINLARNFAYRHSDLSIRVRERDPTTMIICHPGALKHALAELIANALIYSPPDGEVIISQWRTEAGEAWASISDQGTGIPPKLQARALEGFRQINRETHEQQGMGLGLPLARRIVEEHGGALELSSVVGKGTEVRVRLPIFDENDAQ